MLSRATTLGEEGKPETSSILFKGPNMSPHRIKKATCGKKDLYTKVRRLRKWAQYLESNELDSVENDKIEEMRKWVDNMIQNAIEQTDLAKWVNNTVSM